MLGQSGRSSRSELTFTPDRPDPAQMAAGGQGGPHKARPITYEFGRPYDQDVVNI